MNKNTKTQPENFKSLPEILLSKSKTSKISEVKKTVKPVPVKSMIKTSLKKPKVEIPLEHENYFVYLKNPLEYRRHLLESSRKILFCLKNHNNIIIIRQRKLEEIKKLKNSVRELIYLNKKFNEKLPKYAATSFEEAASVKILQKPVVPVHANKPKHVEHVKEKTELERLEESLANVEKKLQNLK